MVSGNRSMRGSGDVDRPLCGGSCCGAVRCAELEAMVRRRRTRVVALATAFAVIVVSVVWLRGAPAMVRLGRARPAGLADSAGPGGLSRPGVSDGAPEPAALPESVLVAAAGSTAVRDDAARRGRCPTQDGAVGLDDQQVRVDGLQVGVVELRYSPSCGAAWGRFIPADQLRTLRGARLIVTVAGVRPADGARVEVRTSVNGSPVVGLALDSTDACVFAEVTVSDARSLSASTRTRCFQHVAPVS